MTQFLFGMFNRKRKDEGFRAILKKYLHKVLNLIYNLCVYINNGGQLFQKPYNQMTEIIAIKQ